MLSLAVLSAILVPLSQALPICHSHTQPNPIASVHPNDATGVINGTTAIVPIPYDIARQIVPAQYAILKSAYHEIFPDLPSNIYPAVLEAVQDHDVQQLGIGIPDFTVSISVDSSHHLRPLRALTWQPAHGPQVSIYR